MKSLGNAEFVVRQEPDLVDRKKLRRVVLLCLIAVFMSLVTTALLLRAADAERAAPMRSQLAPEPPGTVETTLITATERGVTMRAEQRTSLARYGWADRDAGVARIPIERAIDIVLEREVARSGPARGGARQ